MEDAGLRTSVVAAGPDALLALMDDDGHVDGGELGVVDDALAAELSIVELNSHDVVLVELAALDRVESYDPLDPERRAAVRVAIESAYRAVVAAPYDDALMMVVTPAPPRDRGQLGVFTLQGATTAPDDTVTARGPGSVYQSPHHPPRRLRDTHRRGPHDPHPPPGSTCRRR